jgi:uncharacterized damage-inducible protein DinB
MTRKEPDVNPKDYFVRMSRYNRWMNENLYAACATLPDSVRKEDRGAFFRSIHGILNHLLLADGTWMARFRGEPNPYHALDQEVCADFDELRRAREALDAEIEAYVRSLEEADLSGLLTFRFMSAGGGERTEIVWRVLIHLFNHQTHHRGQLTTLLDQLGCDYHATDILAMPDPELPSA